MAGLVADENIKVSLVEALRQDGHDILYIAEYAGGISDDAVLDIASEQQRFLLTEDKDFGELVFRLKRDLPGVILIRLTEVFWQSHYERLAKMFREHEEELNRRYVVVEGERFRFRSMP